MSEKKEHKHADLLRAVADGKEIQTFYEAFGTPDYIWEDISHEAVLRAINHCGSLDWRIKPEPKPDVITHMFVEVHPKLDNAYNKPNLRLTFDGETQKLKAVRILDAA